MCRHIVSVQTMERYLGSKHRFRLLMSGISATASVRRRFARKTDYVIIYGSVFSCAGAAAVQGQSHGRGGWMIDESRDAPQLEAALLFEYEMMRIETYSRQPDLMFHANDFRVADRFQLGLAILRGAFSQRGDCQSAYGVL